MPEFRIGITFTHKKTVYVRVKAKTLEAAVESAERRKSPLYLGETMRRHVIEESSSMDVFAAEPPSTSFLDRGDNRP